jgi:hypothetical protein
MFNGVEYGYDQIGNSFYNDIHESPAPRPRSNNYNGYGFNNTNTFADENDILIRKLMEIESSQRSIGSGVHVKGPASLDQLAQFERPRMANIDYSHSSACQCPRCQGERNVRSISEQKEIRRMLHELRDKNDKLTIFVILSLVFMLYYTVYRPNFDRNAAEPVAQLSQVSEPVGLKIE